MANKKSRKRKERKGSSSRLSKTKKRRMEPKNQEKVEDGFLKYKILGLFLIVIAIVFLLGFLRLAGVAGNKMSLALESVLGWASWGFLLVLIFGARIFFGASRFNKIKLAWIGLLLIFLGLTAILHLMVIDDPLAVKNKQGGGYLGFVLTWPFFQIFGFWASLVIFLAVIAAGFIFIFSSRYPKEEQEEEQEEKEDLLPLKVKINKKKLKQKAILPSSNKKTVSLRVKKDVEPLAESNFIKKVKPTPSTYPLNLLEFSEKTCDPGDIEETKEIIRKTLESFSIPVEMGEVQVGPTVTQYTLRPAQGIKLSQITSLSNDLALALARHPIRIEAPIPGKSFVGIEVPNQKGSIVRLKDLLVLKEFTQQASRLTLALGKDVAGRVYFDDLVKMPHLLIAGATGSGKTVMLNSIILTLLYQNSSADLRFVLIDPKRVELTLYKNLPHLLTVPLTDVNKALSALKWLLKEMTRRFETLEEHKKRNIEDYNNQEGVEKLPYIVVVIDELADLMVAAAHEVETCIVRLTQMARATGIHLILATQRPSVDVITGLIKANITNRIAFSVASMADSRTILDFSGAEKLLGQGDMLYISPRLSRPKRLQAPYISDKEIKNVVSYLSQEQEQEDYVDIEQELSESLASNGLKGLGTEEDELLDQAREEVLKANKASATFLQRRLRIGYARAARLLDLLEQEGTVGPAEGSRPRQVFRKQEEE